MWHSGKNTPELHHADVCFGLPDGQRINSVELTSEVIRILGHCVGKV